jgi:hypothetical protein
MLVQKRGGKIPSLSHYGNFYGTLLHMSDNVVRSTDVNKPAEKPAKKAAVKKVAAAKADAAPSGVNKDLKIIVFESGSSYTADGVRFTQNNRIQEVSQEVAEKLLELDNFRLPNQFEIEDYFNSKED